MNNSKSNNEHEDYLCLGKYNIIEKLGEGSFGMIFKGSYKNNLYALKFEKIIPGHKSMLVIENIAMSALNHKSIPKVYDLAENYNKKNEYNIMVMELLGKSLETLLKLRPTQKLSVKTCAMLGYQMVDVLEYIHSEGIIHRDIKPDNFCLGGSKKTRKTLYIIDFGLAKKYMNSETQQHNALIQSKKLTGTARYASINALQGFEQSRRDDLESVGYVLLYLVNGVLPWQGFHDKNKADRYAKILGAKMTIGSDELCEGLPVQFQDYLEYCKNLKFEEKPNYDYLKGLFKQVVNDLGFDMDYVYDWDCGSNKVLSKEAMMKEEEEHKKYLNKKLNKYMDAVEFLNNEELFNIKGDVNNKENDGGNKSNNTKESSNNNNDKKDKNNEGKNNTKDKNKDKCFIY